jgi:hypothetical protein
MSEARRHEARQKFLLGGLEDAPAPDQESEDGP